MKGLLLKGWYMTVKYCRSYLLITFVFILVSVFSGSDPLFFLLYPMLLAGMVPVTLLSYDERSRWNVFSGALPYSKAQLVSAKYIATLVLLGGSAVATLAALSIRMVRLGEVDLLELLGMTGLLLSAGLFVPALLLPIIFRFGVEKGRMAYYIVIGLVCAVVVFIGMAFLDLPQTLSLEIPAIAALSAAICVFAVSWLLAVRLYKAHL